MEGGLSKTRLTTFSVRLIEALGHAGWDYTTLQSPVDPQPERAVMSAPAILKLTSNRLADLANLLRLLTSRGHHMRLQSIRHCSQALPIIGRY